MPFPKSQNVGKLVSFIKREHPEWPHDKVIAAALNQARRSGKKIPKRSAKNKKRKQ